MFDIEITKKKDIDVIDSKLLHKELNVKSYHSDWIRRRIDNYQFEEGADYFNSKMSKSIGRPTKTYLLTLDMAKELCMLENNLIGKKTRKYFIKAEKKLRKIETIRLAGIEVRKSLTDAVQDSGEQERMHGHGYSTYTNMVYEICGLKDKAKEHKALLKATPYLPQIKFRDYLEAEQLKRVELAESLIKPLLELDKQYSEIRDTLKPLFSVKRVEDGKN